VRAAVKDVSRLWWLWLLFGLAWTVIAVVILQFDDASVTTVGIIGLLLYATGLQALLGAAIAEQYGWVYALFGILFLIAGILMIILAFWTAGQLFIDKAYVLLVFAGIWALMHGLTDIIRAFQIRRIGKLL
jgi:uncharacterized membrane protein HdeD (DUF308 family)